MKNLDAIYFAARELPPGDRPAYLAKAYGADSALRSRVEQMLAVAEKAEAFITDVPDESRSVKIHTLEIADLPNEFIGQKIGRYKILERVGEGGCGVVYVAEQTEPVRRRVALKVIKLGMDTRQVVARFEAERQALAMMDHPNIAKVHDAGTTDTGRPFFVMELVPGTRFIDYCDQASLSTNERLDLFIKVCHAIQHAHQKGIIHRDIKPSNILVTLLDGAAVPKVIDFGIAKATEGRLTEATVYTQLHQFIGTPAYMSPEQAEMSALDIDTRSDIYSLGVLLYELLTGHTPFDAKQILSMGLDEVRRTIREVEPVKPSTRLKRETTTTNARSLADKSAIANRKSQIDPDLDWIVMKCLEKDRLRRYETASGLANDLKRYLGHEPVVARPPSMAYRIGKAFQRNRLAFIAVFSVALALLAGTVISTWQAVEATRARKDESRERVAAQQAEAHASAQQKKAEAEKQRAEEQLTRAEWLLYASKLMLAQNDFEAGNGGLAAHYLAECPEKLRGWEWRYLSNRISAKLTLTGHTNAVSSAAFTADGRRILTASHDKTAKVWDAITGEELLTIQGHKGDIYCMALSPDGRRIVTGGGMLGQGILPGEAKVWDAATGQHIFDLKGHSYPLWDAAFSPDGRRIATAAGERVFTRGEVKVWDSVTGQELLTLPDDEDARCVAFSPDGQRIATGGNQGNVKLWDAATGEKLLTLTGHTFMITGVAFSPDGARIVSSSWGKTAKVWDAETGQEIFALKGHDDVVYGATFSPDGTRIATSSWDQTTKIWDARTGQEIFTLKGHASKVFRATYSRDGKRIVTASNDRTAKVWNAESGQEIPTLWGHRDSVSSIAFSPDGRRMVTGSTDGTAKMWDTATWREILTIGTPGYWNKVGVWSVAFSPDGKRIITGSQDKVAKVSDAVTGRQLLVLDHADAVATVAFSPDGLRLLTGIGGWGVAPVKPSDAKLWDAATGKEILAIRHPCLVWSVAFSPDAKRILTGTSDGIARLWDARSGEELVALKGHSGVVHAVAFSPSGKFIATGSQDSTAKLWDAATGKELRTLKGHTAWIASIVFSPDGERIVTGSADRTAKIWDTGSGQEVFALKGHSEKVWGLAFSPDGQRIVTGTAGPNETKMWSAAPTP